MQAYNHPSENKKAKPLDAGCTVCVCLCVCVCKVEKSLCLSSLSGESSSSGLCESVRCGLTTELKKAFQEYVSPYIILAKHS